MAGDLLDLNIDAKWIEPVVVLGVLGVAGYFLFQYLSQQQAANASNNQASSLNDAEYQSESDELLASLLTGSGTVQTQNVDQVTQSAPVTTASPAGGTAPASNTSALTSTPPGATTQT
jgi:hypothetical protein